jgi:prolyl-tRNA synthetase
MRYRELQIQTQREAPNNARSEGAAWLVRAGYLSREGEVLPLGQQALERIRSAKLEAFGLPLLSNAGESFFPISNGAMDVLHCPACGAVASAGLASFRKFGLPEEVLLPVEKVETPECPTIESLAAFLNLPKEKTAKALMFTRITDGQLIFVVVRGDMTLSEAKLRRHVGEVRLATPQEIEAAGAVPGYASPLGLKDAFIAVDDLVPVSFNLAAGANEHGFHLLNVNCGRDYKPDLVADLALAGPGSPCAACNTPMDLYNAEPLRSNGQVDTKAVLLALAESNRDEKGLRLPSAAAPFDVYLMQVTGRELDTLSRAAQLYEQLEQAGLRVLFDDRDERAGVKFNDADLVGCPVRVTVGERGLKEGKVELKERAGAEQRLVELGRLGEELKSMLGEP